MHNLGVESTNFTFNFGWAQSERGQREIIDAGKLTLRRLVARNLSHANVLE